MMYSFIKRTKQFLALCCFLCVGLPWSVLATMDYTIRAIQVEGNTFADSEVLVALSGVQVGTKIHASSKTIPAAIRKIAKQEGIKSVSIYLTEVDEANALASLCIKVEEYPRLDRYTIEGLTKKEKNMLLEKEPIPNGAVLSSFFIHTKVTRIKALFIEKGFKSVQVSTHVTPTKASVGKAVLHIKIKKGTKHTVHSIVFEGNNHLDSDRLVYTMKALKPAPHFTLFKDLVLKIATLAPIQEGGVLLKLPTIEDTMCYLSKHISFFPVIFSEKKLDKAKENLIRLYQSKGFRDARIVEEQLRHIAPGKLQVVLKIDEGKQYKIRRIHWIGNHAYSDQQLNQLLRLQEGNTYDPIYIHKRLSPGMNETTIADLYTNHGYLFFRAEAVEIGIEEGQIDLEIRIYEGKQATINKIDIVGNTITHDYVIRRELTTFPGEKFNRARVLESLQNLALLNFFKPEKLIPEIHPNEANGTVDLTYRVAEQPKFDLKLNASYSKGMVLELVLGCNNVALHQLFKGKIPLGAAQHFNLSGALRGKDYKNVRLAFQEPWLWLGSKRYLLSLSFDNSHQVVKISKWTPLDRAANLVLFPCAAMAHKKSTITSLGGRIALGKKLARYWESYFGIGCHRHTYQHYALLEDQKKRSGRLYSIIFDLSFAHNSINSLHFPTAGWSWSNLLTVTPPYAACGYADKQKAPIPRFKEFGKLMMDFSLFQSLFSDLVLNLRAHGGFLNSLSKKEIGPFERFYLGGGQSMSAINTLLGADVIPLRGYPDDSLTPKDYQRHIQGGVLYQKAVAELRYPLMRAPACVYVLGFLEAGDAWLAYSHYNLFGMKKSVGVGIRIHLPISIIPMVGMDFGYRMDPVKDIHERKNKFECHFSLGPSIR